MRPLTHTRNKHLIELAGKPMIVHVIEQVAEAGIFDIGIIVGEHDEEIERALGDGSFWNVRLTYIPQIGGARGIAHAVQCAHNFLGEEQFLLYLGDNIIGGNLRALKEEFERGGQNCLLTLVKVPRPERFGVPEIKDGRIVRVEERPVEPKSPFAVAGVYFYDASAHEAIANITPSMRGDLEISDVHSWLAKNGYNVSHVEVDRWWKDRGNPKDLLEGNRLFLEDITYENKGTIEPTVKVEGVVKIGEGARIGGHTVLRGPLTIGERCLIKDSYIGPYTSLGSNVEIHGGSIEYSLVFEDASIVTPTHITDSIIGHGSSIRAKDIRHPKGYQFIVGDNSSLAI